jgi:hypothetical protein
MSLVSEQERKNLASVGTSRVAALLASVEYGEEPDPDGDEEPGAQLHGMAISLQEGDTSKEIDISMSADQRGKELRTQKVTNIPDPGHPHTFNSIRASGKFLSYTLLKDGIGKVRFVTFACSPR